MPLNQERILARHVPSLREALAEIQVEIFPIDVSNEHVMIRFNFSDDGPEVCRENRHKSVAIYKDGMILAGITLRSNMRIILEKWTKNVIWEELSLFESLQRWVVGVCKRPQPIHSTCVCNFEHGLPGRCERFRCGKYFRQ